MRFLKKYKLIIFLIVMIVVLAVVKLLLGGDDKSEISKITPTPTKSQMSNEELFGEYQKIETEEEREIFLNKLTIKERDYILAEEPAEGRSLEYSLPYETNDFVVEKYVRDGVILVKIKGSNLEEIKKEVIDWVNKNKDEGENIVFVWY